MLNDSALNGGDVSLKLKEKSRGRFFSEKERDASSKKRRKKRGTLLQKLHLPKRNTFCCLHILH